MSIYSVDKGFDNIFFFNFFQTLLLKVTIRDGSQNLLLPVSRLAIALSTSHMGFMTEVMNMLNPFRARGECTGG